MTDIIDLISSSPPPLTKTATPAPLARDRSPDLPPARGFGDHIFDIDASPCITANEDIDQPSIPPKLTESPGSLDLISESSLAPARLSPSSPRPGRRKRRLSHEDIELPAAEATCTSLITSRDGVKKKRVDDPIEFTSSLDHSAVAKARVESKSSAWLLFSSSPKDTNASMPPMPTAHLPLQDATGTHNSRINKKGPNNNGKTFHSDLVILSSSPRRPPRVGADWDPISSSAPELSRGVIPASQRESPTRGVSATSKGKQAAQVIGISSSPVRGLGSESDEFPDLETIRTLKPKPYQLPPLPPERHRKPGGLARSHSLSTAYAGPSRPSTANSRNKALDKEKRAEQREAEKERKKREREAVRAEKAREKERAAALAEVNKVRTDKKVSTPEMITFLPSSLSEAVALQAKTLLDDLRVQCDAWDSPVANVVTWKRKVNSRYNEDLGHWEPIPHRVDDEAYALVIIEATQFVNLCTRPDTDGITQHFHDMKTHFKDYAIIYLIEGLDPWMRKNRTLRNRQFASAARGEPSAPPPSQSSSRRQRPAQTDPIDEELIEEGLLRLQVRHSALIHHTNLPIETAQWITTFTQHISTVPYRRQKESHNASSAAFCMDSGQVRSGDGARETYALLLQEVTRVTAPMAYGILAKFGSVTKLVEGFETGGALAVQDCQKCTNKDGSLSDRVVGQAVSRRLHKIFMGVDEASMDV